MTPPKIPFNQPYMTGKEQHYIAEAKLGNMLAGDGPFTKRCHQWIEQNTGCAKALLTHSCTAALEMMALLLDIRCQPPTRLCCAVGCRCLLIFVKTH